MKILLASPSITWDDCVVAAICWGWIDGLRKAMDDTSFLQRLTPRRARSNWSQKNVHHAERLIEQGRMAELLAKLVREEDVALLRHMQTPGGHTMSVRATG